MEHLQQALPRRGELRPRFGRGARQGSPLRGAAATLCLLVGAGHLASAQQEDAPPLADVVEVVEVVLVNVEVWVQDRKGDPIHGLTVDDFEVFEDGRRMEITHLAEIRGAAVDERGDPIVLSPSVDAAGSADAAESAVPAGAPVDPPHLVVYFDEMHLSPTSARRVVKDLRKFLKREQVPLDRVAILRQEYDLELVASFGSTQQELEDALVAISKSINAAGGDVAARQALQRMQMNWDYARGVANPCRVMANLTKAEIRSRVEELRHHFGITMDNLGATARFLAGLPGLKTLVLVSDSLELRPGQDLLRFAQNVCPNEADLRELSLLGDATEQSKVLQEFASSANANRVTFYPLQASGLTYSSTFGAENRALETVATRGVDMTLRQVQRAGLLTLADETGGVAALNRNNFLEPLETIARDMQTYYSLAYVPPNVGDGRNHSIEVKVDVPRATVRHRLGYRDKSAAEKRGERLDGAIAFGVMDNPAGIRLAVGQLEKSEDDRFEIPLHLLVPSDRIVFLPGPSQSLASAEIVVRAREASTGETTETSEVVRAERPAEETALTDFAVDLTLAPGVYVLGVAWRDMATGETSVVSTTIAVQDAG